MIRLSAQLRATIQRTLLPLLVLLSAAIIVLGKADQAAVRVAAHSVTDGVAPVLDALSRPLAAVDGVVDRVRGVVTALPGERPARARRTSGCCNGSRSRSSSSAENQQLRGLLKAGAGNAVSYVTARVIANSGGAYVRTVMVNAGAERRRGARPGGDDRRGAGRPADRGRQPRRARPADHRSQLAHPGRRSTASRDQRGAGRRQFRAAAAALPAGEPSASRSATGSSPRARAACSRRACRSASSRRSTAQAPRVEPYVELSQLGYRAGRRLRPGAARCRSRCRSLARPKRRGKTPGVGGATTTARAERDGARRLIQPSLAAAGR